MDDVVILDWNEIRDHMRLRKWSRRIAHARKHRFSVRYEDRSKCQGLEGHWPLIPALEEERNRRTSAKVED